MNPEYIPEIPHPEHPEHDWLKNAAETAVAEKVAEMDIGLDLDRHPELRSRLAEIGSHFEDSLAMARIVQALYGQLREPLGLTDDKPQRLMRAAVLHDIGKSGPPGQETDFHVAVRRLFVPPGQPFNPYIDGRAKTISEFVLERDMARPEEIISALKAEGIDPEKEPMIDFWRRHADWSYGILAAETGPDVDPELVNIAASHHFLENRNPAALDVNRVPAEAHVLEVLEQVELLTAIDKYQAMRGRGRLKHAAAVARLAEAIESRTDLPEALREKFRKVIDVLGKSKEDLERFFRRESGA